jgi:hypothetical protein
MPPMLLYKSHFLFDSKFKLVINIMSETYQFSLSSLVEARKRKNYKIINSSVKNKKCIVFFSGNGLYFPNTNVELDEVIDKERYEWESICPNNYEKIIFVRDIYKQWYVEGISDEIDNIDKLKEFLSNEIVGLETTFVGSSAGGYAAVLFGNLCSANLIISLSGQFDLTNEVKCIDRNKLLHYAKDQRYVKIDNLDNRNVIYFNPMYSEIDAHHNSIAIKNINITLIQIKSSIHGVPLYPFSLKKILCLKHLEYKKLSRHKHNMLLLSLKYSTLNDFLYWFFKRIKKRLLLSGIRR